LLSPFFSAPTRVASQLGDDYDEGAVGLAQRRLEYLWIKDMFTTLQILRVNGSPKAPDRRPYEWMVSNLGSAPERARLAIKAIARPETVTAFDYLGLPSDQIREVKAFLGLRTWDDPVRGLPRHGMPGAGALSDAEEDQLEFIRRRRAVATEKKGTVIGGGGKGLQYGGAPSKDPNPTGATSGSLDAEIWRELDLEGSASAVNTYDDQVFTWGKGWSAKTTLPAIADAFFAADPGARNELMEAGFTHRAAENKWLFVSLDQQCVLEGIPALEAFRKDRKFVGLLAHLVEDPQHQQAMVDAQWGALSKTGNAGAVPAAIRSAWPSVWTTTAVRFGAHCVHWGLSWGQVQAHGPALADLVKWISRLKGTKQATGALIVSGWPSQTIRHFANHAAQDLMTGPSPLPTPTAAGTFYFQQDGGKPNYWVWTP
jgi:hypothetical protein